MSQATATSDGWLQEYPAVRASLRQMPAMAAVWAGFGVLTGVLTAPGTGPVAIAAGVIAGLIVLTPFGVVLAVCGGKWRDSLACGLLGLGLVPLFRELGVTTGTSLVPVAL